MQVAMRLSRRVLVLATSPVTRVNFLGFDEYLRRAETVEDILADPRDYDTAIIPGTGKYSRWRARVDGAATLYLNRKVRKVLITEPVESVIQYAVDKRVKRSDLLFDEKSKSTPGKAYYLKNDILLPNHWFKNIVVTNSPHVPRCRIIFEKTLGRDFETRYVKSDVGVPPSNLENLMMKERVKFLGTKFLLSLAREGDDAKISLVFKSFAAAAGTRGF